MLLSFLVASALPVRSAPVETGAVAQSAPSVPCLVTIENSGRRHQVRCPAIPIPATDARGPAERGSVAPSDPSQAP